MDKITLEEHYILEAYRLLTDDDKEFVKYVLSLAKAGVIPAEDFRTTLWHLVRMRNYD